jgi:hypothetical protein
MFWHMFLIGQDMSFNIFSPVQQAMFSFMKGVIPDIKFEDLLMHGTIRTVACLVTAGCHGPSNAYACLPPTSVNCEQSTL